MSDLSTVGDAEPLIKSLKGEVGTDSITREMLDVYSSIFKRYVRPSETFSKLINKIANKKPSLEYDAYGKFHFLISYFYINENESLWTGDILFDKEKQMYCINITPECDFAQNKADHVNLVYGERIDHVSFQSEEEIEAIKAKFGIKGNNDEVAGLILGDNNLPDKYKPLCYIKEVDGKDVFHILLDLQKTSSMLYKKNMKDNPNFTRICRVDKPLINQIQQDYGVFISRIGTMNVPRKVANNVKFK